MSQLPFIICISIKITSREHPWVAYHQEKTDLGGEIRQINEWEEEEKRKRKKMVQPETISLTEIASRIYSWWLTNKFIFTK